MMTMSEIARLSGVARSTVHAVLVGKTWVSEETRSKVMEVVQKYNYRPNRMAASLVGKPTKLIGLLLRDLLNPFNSQLIEGVQGVLAEHQYSTLLLNPLDRHEEEVRAIEVALGYQVDGMIIAPLQLGVDLQHLHRLRDSGKPFVTLGRIPGIPTSYVAVDEQQAAFLATEHLIQHGHRHICHLRGPHSALAAEERVTGFKNALLRHGLRFDETMIVDAGTLPREGYDAAMPLLSGQVRPTAVLCYNDLIAAGVYKAAAELHLSIPSTLSVVGIDDIELAAVFGPPLTTVRQPCHELGQALAQLLLNLLAEPAHPPQAQLLPVELVCRQSVQTLA